MNRFIDQASIVKEISERENIILTYRKSGYLDRDSAIKKIKELRLTDEDVAEATAPLLAVNPIPFDQASDADIAGELELQIAVLIRKMKDC